MRAIALACAGWASCGWMAGDAAPRTLRGGGTAEYQLGQRYQSGNGVCPNDAEAAHWYRKAAEAGYAEAENELGFFYENGLGVPQNHAEAARWYRRAAEQGNRDGEFNLGYLYDAGLGVPLDPAAAVRWYTKAARQGDYDAEFDLGVMYEQGQGVSRDDRQALRWFRKAAEQNVPVAQSALGDLYMHLGQRTDVAEALRWYRKAAGFGYAPALRELARAYASGRGVARDSVQAYAWMDVAVLRARGALKEQYSAEQQALAGDLRPEQLADARQRGSILKRKWTQ